MLPSKPYNRGVYGGLAHSRALFLRGKGVPRQERERDCSRLRQPSALLPGAWGPHFSTATQKGEVVQEPCAPILREGKLETREVCPRQQSDSPEGPEECPKSTGNVFGCPG